MAKSNAVVAEVESVALHAAKVFVFAGASQLVAWAATQLDNVHNATVQILLGLAINTAAAYLQKRRQAS